METLEKLKGAVRDIVDFPKKGIVFKDITPILANGELFHSAIEWLSALYRTQSIDAVVGIDARGFIFAGAVAANLKIGMIPVRKKGKLPFKTESLSYALEYGSSELEIHCDALKPGARVAIVDDLLATGGTAVAAAKLIEKLGAKIVGATFLIELTFLDGRKKLSSYPVTSAIQY